MTIVGKRKICYKKKCMDRTVHQDPKTKKKYIMVGKSAKGHGTKRKYI